MLRGARARREDMQELAAWTIAHVVSPHVKTAPRVEKILGRPMRAKREAVLREKRQREREQDA